MSQHYSDARAVLPRRAPEQKNMIALYLPDTPPRGHLIDGLSSVGFHSEVRRYRAIPDGNGGFLRDKAGNPVLGRRLKTLGVY